jgi:adenylate cyclase
VRVHRNFAFVDLSGFTAFTETQGDERAVSMLSSFRGLVRDICSRRGVRIAKWLGDGAMLVNIEPTPVVAATVEMQFAVARGAHPAQIRCGVSSGEVILLEGDDYIGHSVNVAARLCDLAQSGEVLATPSIVEHLPPWATVRDSEDRMVRGLENALPVARIGLRDLVGTVSPDPICGIPLTRVVAVEADRDSFGEEILFCSDSCYDTWQRRPRQKPEGQGSLRTPLIGS